MISNYFTIIIEHNNKQKINIMNNPTISVVMPVYNTKTKYLKESIQSILNQTFTDFEFIIINDGSTKSNVVKTILSFDDPRIKFINNNKNIGIAETLNNSFKISQGKYIARMDSDDISLPKRFEMQIKFMQNNPECGLLGGGFEYFGKKNGISINPKTVKTIDLLYGCFISHPTVMIRKELVNKYNIQYDKNYDLCEDYELWSRIASQIKICNLQKVIVKYRWHTQNVSVKKNKEQYEQMDLVKKNIIKSFTDNKILQEKLMDSYINNIFKINLFKIQIFKIKIINHMNIELYLFGIKIYKK